MLIDAIVSGGQTGADRAAMEFARAVGIELRGRVPKGRIAEDGVIPLQYTGLIECESADPAVRTRLNVRDSDGTVVFSHGEPQGGSGLAVEEARRLGRPLLLVDLQRTGLAQAAASVRQWLREQPVPALNVAGPRASEDSRIFGKTLIVLALALLAND